MAKIPFESLTRGAQPGGPTGDIGKDTGDEEDTRPDRPALMRTLYVLYVEDDFVLGKAVELALSKDSIEVALAPDVASARRLLRSPRAERWDAILLDLKLPDGRGDCLFEDVDALGYVCPVILFTGEANEMRPSTRARRPSVVVKPIEPSKLAAIVRQSVCGATIPTSIQSFSQHYGLSLRECEIVTLAAKGLDAKAMAARLGGSVHTVRAHWKKIYAKTRTRTVGAVVAKLFDWTSDSRWWESR